MKRLALVLFVAAGLSACAQQPVSSPESRSSTSGTERPENFRAKVHTDLAAQYYSMRKYAIALQEAHESLSADAGYPPAFNMLGLVHAELAEDATAENYFKRAIAGQRNYSEAHNNFGYFLCQRGRFAEGLEQFDQALKNPLYPSPERAMANAGLCAQQKGDWERAENYLQRALARDPQQVTALLAMAEQHLHYNNPLGAQAALQRLQARGAQGSAVMWLGVRVERQLGNREAEANYGAQLRRQFPESRETRWLLNGQYDKNAYEQTGGMP